MIMMSSDETDELGPGPPVESLGWHGAHRRGDAFSLAKLAQNMSLAVLTWHGSQATRAARLLKCSLSPSSHQRSARSLTAPAQNMSLAVLTWHGWCAWAGRPARRPGGGRAAGAARGRERAAGESQRAAAALLARSQRTGCRRAARVACSLEGVYRTTIVLIFHIL